LFSATAADLVERPGSGRVQGGQHGRASGRDLRSRHVYHRDERNRRKGNTASESFIINVVDAGASVGVLSNDTDPDIHGQLVVSAVNGSAASVGHVVQGAYVPDPQCRRSYLYAANKGALPSQIVAQDTFTVSDGHGGTDAFTLSVVAFNPGVIYQPGMNTTLTGAVDSKNVLDGSAGYEVSGSAADVLIGGKGDTLTGGAGPDTFAFRPNFGTNVITDFNVINEAVQIDNSIFATVNDVLAHNTPAGAVINDGHGDTVTLAGVTLSQLQTHQTISTCSRQSTLAPGLALYERLDWQGGPSVSVRIAFGERWQYRAGVQEASHTGEKPMKFVAGAAIAVMAIVSGPQLCPNSTWSQAGG
jgi:hypothetical protein